MARGKPTLFDQLRSEQRLGATDQTLNSSTILRVVIISLAVVGVLFCMPGRTGDRQDASYDKSIVGTVWTEESVIADYSFPVPKPPTQLRAEQQQAAEDTPVEISERQDALALAYKQASQLYNESTLPPTNLALQSRINSALEFVYNKGIISVSHRGIPSQFVIISDTSGERIVERASVLDTVQAFALAQKALGVQTQSDVEQLHKILKGSIHPNLIIDSASWNRSKEDAERSIAVHQELVHKGDVIVRKGVRVDEATVARLAAYRAAQYLRADIQFSVLVVVGAFGHAAIIISTVLLYLLYCRSQSFYRNGQLASLLAMPLLAGIMGWLSLLNNQEIPFEFVIIVPALSMVISVLYDARTSIVVTLAMALAVGGARGNDYAITVILFSGGALGAYAATNIQKRSQIFTSIIAVLFGLLVSLVAIDLERAVPIGTVGIKVGLGTINAVISPLIALAIIMIVERTLNIATDLRLEEFDNINHKLLLQLNERAPGTYQHTMAVARLSEAAAAAIGANPLLAKVGTYFHDIGKLEKSEYFVENQIDIDNKHDKISARKSAAIIRQHVQDGIELAREYRLPMQIIKFIPMHHGTILIKHFYAKALEEADGTTKIDETDFRYPGPKPDSKETAIVMLADAVEALSRLVDTSQREDLEEAVDKIIQQRTQDGQFNECPITLSELEIIKETFIKNLLGATHQRVRYKEVPEPPLQS